MGRMMLNVYRERRTVRPPDDPNLRELRGLPAVPVGSCHLSWRVLSHSVARPVKYSVNPQGTLFTPATKYTVTGWPSWRPNKLRKSWACRHKEACAAAAISRRWPPSPLVWATCSRPSSPMPSLLAAAISASPHLRLNPERGGHAGQLRYSVNARLFPRRRFPVDIERFARCAFPTEARRLRMPSANQFGA